MAAPCSLARTIRDGSEAAKAEAWTRLAQRNGTGIAHDIWKMTEREIAEDGLSTDGLPRQEPLW